VVDSAVVRVGHLEIAYRVAGGPEARPLVLLHALGEDSGDWGEVIDALAPTRRVYAPDLRGHGRSSWPGLYSLELMRADVLSFLDALELPVVDMVGHSLGGVVAYLLAEEQPARVERLVLEEPAPPLPATPPRQVPSRTDGPLTFDWAVVEALTAQRNAPDPEWWAQLPRITASKLVVAGGSASHLPQNQLADLAARIPGGRAITIEAGHEVHATEPARFLTVVEAFLRR